MVSDMADTTTVDEAFRCMTEQPVKMLCCIFDCVLQDGSLDWKYLGKGEQLERKWRPVLPPQAKEDGTADGKMTSLALLHLRFAELAALLFRYAAEPTRNCTNLFLQWNAITAKLRGPNGALREAIVGTIWEMRPSIIGT